jgi:CrcB protein
MTASVLVGLGGCVGSLARYGLSLLAQRYTMDWPLGTFAANCLGCLAIGVVAELAARGEVITPEVRLLLATGFCGGFTTMSSMVYETGQMLRADELLHASAYVAATLLCSLAAFFAGAAGVRLLTRMAGALWS